MQIELSKIVSNPKQPRTGFDDGEMASLAASLETNGLLNPISVEGPHENGIYILLDGERRVRAAKIDGWTHIEANVRPPDGAVPHNRLVLALVGNMQRADMGMVDEAMAFRQLIDNGFSITQIAEQVGRTTGHVYGRLRLLDMPSEVQEAFNTGKIPYDPYMVQALQKLSPEQMVTVIKIAAEHDLSGRSIMATCKRISRVKTLKTQAVKKKQSQVKISDQSTCPALDLNPGLDSKQLHPHVRKTCQECGLFEERSASTICRECPLTLFLGRLAAGGQTK